MYGRGRLAAAALAAVLCACGGGGTAPTKSELAGTWKASKVEFVNASNSSQKVELVATGGVYTLVLRSDGSYTLTGTHPGDSDLTVSGTYDASVDVFTLHFATGLSGEAQFDYSLGGNTLTLNGGHMLYDVNGDDQMEEARLNLVLVRQ